jgi:hypothetical protein
LEYRLITYAMASSKYENNTSRYFKQGSPLML